MSASVSHYDQVRSLDELIGELKILNERGYKILEPIGEGQTRAAYKVLYEKGPVRRLRVLKLPKTQIQDRSVTTRVNLRAGDVNEREVLTLNEIRNPHIIEIYEAFSLPNGETATVEEWYDALSLEDLVRLSGPLSEDQFRKVFSQAIDGFHFLHEREGILHRDIKPSNILVGRSDSFVKITDLQNAARRRDVHDRMLPTRGGTAYTDPRILNSLFEERETSCDIRSEFYALGATMYFALTGKTLFDRSLICQQGGKRIQLGEEFLEVVLEEDGEVFLGIDLTKHDKDVKRKIKVLPRKYRDLIQSLVCFSDDPYGVTVTSDHYRLRDRFDSATRKTRIDWRKVKEHALWGTVGAACLAGLIGGAGFLRWQDSVTVEPTLVDALRTVNFRDWDLRYLEHAVDGAMLGVLQPSFQEIAEHRVQLDAFHEKQYVTIHNLVAVAGVSNRLAFALLESIMLTPQDQIHDQYHAQRYDISLVPREFMSRWLGSSIVSADGRGKFGNSISEWQIIGGGLNYMKKCLIAEDMVSDVFACYVTNPGELAQAQSAMQSSSYFPTLLVESRWVNGHYEEYDEKNLPVHNHWGYRVGLPQVEQDLINRATALYLVMDNEGNLHPEIINPDGTINSEILTQKP